MFFIFLFAKLSMDQYLRDDVLNMISKYVGNFSSYLLFKDASLQ